MLVVPHFKINNLIPSAVILVAALYVVLSRLTREKQFIKSRKSVV